MYKLLIFGGTFEGRMLCEYLSKHSIEHWVSIATDYGKNLLNDTCSNLIVGRLNQIEIEQLLDANNFNLIIDATHPYAVEVSKNIKCACNNKNVPYIRLLRQSKTYENVVSFDCIDDTINYLNLNCGNVLLTTGSKDLHQYTSVKNFCKRLFPRILPSPEVLQACLDLGYEGKNIICMQGPFSHGLNLSLLKQFDCKYLVTKDTGDIGGLEAKIAAATESGAQVLLIRRPVKEQGFSFEQIINYVNNLFSISKHEFFPLFVSIRNKRALVVGGGKIAERRILTLTKFQFSITVVAPTVTEEINTLAKLGAINLFNRGFMAEDMNEAFMVVAATDDREVNRSIGEQAKSKGLWVSVADCKEECNFYFPGVITHNKIVGGLTSGGKSTKELKAVTERLREVLDYGN